MLKVKKGDTVQIMAGKDRGMQAEVLTVMPGRERVVVKGVNIVTKHIKPTAAGKKGERIKMESSIHISNVMVVDPNTKKPSRVGFSIDDKGNKSRIAKKSGKEL